MAVEQIGRGPRPEQNPPSLDEHSAAVFEFFNENVNSFVQEFGLMAELVKGLKIPADERPLFLQKMNMIYVHALKLARSKGAGE